MKTVIAVQSLALVFGAAACSTTAVEPQQRVESSPNSPTAKTADASPAATVPPQPRARPVVATQPKVRPAIFSRQTAGTSNIGPIAIDARWSNYGVYLQRLINSVQTQWERVLIESRISPPSGTTVEVKFVLDSEGKIARIVNVDNRSTAQAGHACVSAITDRAPYGPWTDDMKAVFGNQSEMTFKFYYQ